MSLRDEIKPYIDGNDLVAPFTVTPGTIRASDNGTMFKSEYLLLSLKNGELNVEDAHDYVCTIARCLNSEGNLCRAPNATDQDVVDNHYGVFAACKALDVTLIPSLIKQGMFTNWGFSNNEQPGTIRRPNGTINWPAFLIRQPQLTFAMIVACGEWKWWKVWQWPLMAYTALVIATSCIGAPLNDQDSRRLSWLLIQTVVNDSLLCRLASKLWYNRLYRDYGPDGMKAAVKGYYQKGHPFLKYWIDK